MYTGCGGRTVIISRPRKPRERFALSKHLHRILFNDRRPSAVRSERSGCGVGGRDNASFANYPENSSLPVHLDNGHYYTTESTII